MSNFFSLNTALTGIRAAQVGLDTTSHNIANVNTKGYTRQRVDQASRLPYTSAVGTLGAGVDIAGISRSRNLFLDQRTRAATAEFRSNDALASLLQRAESITGEPENGITAEVNEVWAAFEDLALEPSDLASRRQVIASLDSLTSRVRTIASGWDLLAADTGSRMSVAVDEVNSALTQLAQINRRIPAQGSTEGAPNDLLNERDLLLDKIAGLANVNITINDDQTVTVSLPSGSAGSGGSVTLVAPASEPDQLKVSAAGVMTSVATGFGVRVGGELGGLQQFVRTDLPKLRAELDAFVTSFANTVNGQHAAGFRASDDGTTSQAGGPLLAVHPTRGAAGFTVAITRPEELATAAAAGAGGGPPAAHDGLNALQLAGLRTKSVTTSAGGTTVSATLDERLREMVVGLARNVSTVTGAADAAESLTTAAEMARQSEHGVSLDEEMVGLVAYQRALEASSRVMSALDQVLDVLINRTGVVGR